MGWGGTATAAASMGSNLAGGDGGAACPRVASPAIGANVANVAIGANVPMSLLATNIAATDDAGSRAVDRRLKAVIGREGEGRSGDSPFRRQAWQTARERLWCERWVISFDGREGRGDRRMAVLFSCL